MLGTPQGAVGSARRKRLRIRRSQPKGGEKRRSQAGRSQDRAEEIAARTVNKQRSKEGRTKDGSGGSDRRKTLEGRTKDELFKRADALSIKGRAQMDKPELIEAIRARN
jgi:hypothetical protein